MSRRHVVRRCDHPLPAREWTDNYGPRGKLVCHRCGRVWV